MEKAVDGEAHTQKNSVAASRKSDLRSNGEIRAHEILLRKVLKETPALIEGTTTVVFTSGNVICYTNDGVVWRPC